VVRNNGWFKIMMGWECASAMRTKDEQREAIKRLRSRASVLAMTHPSKHPTTVNENALKKKKKPSINIPASDKQDNYFYQSATTCQHKIYGTHDGTS